METRRGERRKKERGLHRSKEREQTVSVLKKKEVLIVSGFHSMRNHENSWYPKSHSSCQTRSSKGITQFVSQKKREKCSTKTPEVRRQRTKIQLRHQQNTHVSKAMREEEREKKREKEKRG